MMPVRLSLFALLLAVSSSVAAPLDPEMKSPYVWRVVLRVDPHPTLGPAVKKRLIADLKAALGPALGDDFGRVEVIDLDAVPKENREPLWIGFAENGWDALDSDEFRTLTDVKTHFFTVTTAGGKYTLKSRQHDGSTGLASPQVRTKTLSDIDTLSRTAGLMLAADFGTVGTIEPLPEETTRCILRVRGGELPGADRWLKVGDVFQFAVVQDIPRPQPKDLKPQDLRPGEKIPVLVDRKAQPQAYTLVRVAEILRPGVARCDLFTRYATPFVRGRYVVGYRGLKVSTHDGSVSVRVEDAAGKLPPPTAPLQVWASAFSPRALPNDRDLLDRRGDLFSSNKTLSGVAVVLVKLGSGKVERYPVPVLDHGGAVTVRFGFDAVAVRKAKFEDAALRFADKVLDARLAQEELFKAVGRLIDQQEYKQALGRATDGLKGLEASDTRLTTELAELRKDADAADPTPAGTLAAADRLLAGLRLAKPELQAKIDDLAVAVAKADNPAEYEKKFRANEYTRQIAFHERRGEIPEALAQYDLLIDLTDLNEARERKKKLEEEWAPKSREHAATRGYLTDDWQRVTTRSEFDEAIPVLDQKVRELAKLDDKLGLRLAVTVIEGGYTRLGDLLNTLDPELTQDRDEILIVRKTLDTLRKVEEFVREEQKRLEPLSAPPAEEKK